MFRTFVIAFLLACLLGGCATAKRTSKQIDSNGDGHAEQTVTNTDNLSQRSLRYQEKVALVNSLCGLQSERHNEQRLVTSAMPIVIMDGRAVAVPENSATKFYNPNIPPFNMVGCIEEGLRWSGERLVLRFTDFVDRAVTKGLPAYLAYKVFKTAVDKDSVSVKGDNNRVGVSETGDIDIRQDKAGDQSTYNTCAGEIVDGECVLPAEAASKPEACELPEDCSGKDSYLEGSCGEIDPKLVACLAESE